ncbi:MAG TPA: amino acid permease [Gammaproteobacteria bacterium]|nr:amino acid permease [Gammaproteobacteria bacterium]
MATATTADRRSLGLATTTSIVLGNMVGSGVFLLPATMAVFGVYSLWGWCVSTVGALLLAWVFSNLSRRLPKAGGPYAYPREAFGDFAGFQVAWIYWLSIVGTNASIAVAFTSYLGFFVPVLSSNPWYGALSALAAGWVLTGINILGVRAAGRLQLVTVILKLTPLVALGVFGLFHFDLHILMSGHPAVGAGSAINQSAALAMWAFLGLECATVPADHVKDPEKTIPRATMLGTIIAGVFYIVCTTVVMGIIPADVLAKSGAPFADAAKLLWGNWAGSIIAITAIISCFGALNGWILMQGQLPQAVANNGLFPKVLAKESRFGTPMVALVVSSVLASVLVLMSKGGSAIGGGTGNTLIQMFTDLILITTFFTLVPYMLCALAEIVLSRKQKRASNLRLRDVRFAMGGFVFGLWACYGTGEDSLFYGTLLLLAGLPIYVWQTRLAK